MLNENAKLTKRELAELFEVSMTAVTNWERRGCPVVGRRTQGQGRANEYDLEAVLAWRRVMAQRGQPQGGRRLEDMPQALWKRPDFQNGLRRLIEEAAWSYVWHWMHSDDGLNLTAGVLMEARGGDKEQARKDLDYVVLSLIQAFTDWIASDRFNRELQTTDDMSLDELWYRFTGRQVTTTPPTDRDRIEMHFPDWLLNTTGQELFEDSPLEPIQA